MNDGTGAPPRMSWNPATDTGGPQPHPPADPASSGFRFDLGGALSRLGLPDADVEAVLEASTDRQLPTSDAAAPEQIAPPLPTRQPKIEPLPTRQPQAEPVASAPVMEPLPTRQPKMEPVASAASAPVIEPLPTRQPQAEPVASAPVIEPLPTRQQSVDSEPARPSELAQREVVAPLPEAPPPIPEQVAPQSHAGRSVFDEPAPAPALPNSAAAAPAPAPAHEPAPAPATPQMPVAPDGSVPILPDTPVVAAPSLAAPIDDAPSTPDLNALRSAQLRANRNQRQGKLFGRTLLALLVLGGLIAGALLFGRSYLFSTEWDPSLTPMVDEIQLARGADFTGAVALVVQSEAQYAETMTAVSVGTSWVDRLPEWRALGLVGAEADAPTVGAQLSQHRVAVYDPDSDTIYQLAAADPATIATDTRLALEHAFVDQNAPSEESAQESAPVSPGFVGVSSMRDIVRRSVDSAAATTAPATTETAVDIAGLPLPIAYEIRAVDSLGDAVLAAARIDAASVQPGDPLPEPAFDLLDDQPANAASGMLQPGERALADPVALGSDDWTLVWGARLPAAITEDLGDVLVADLYRPIDRDGSTCFVAVFETAGEADNAVLLDGMAQWAAAAPTEAQAVATPLDATRVQLEACDPGAAAGVPDVAAAEGLLQRQLARLAG